ncbi:SRPBCC domain-containing protein [Streptomyces sp. NPDC088124]|uniref:SRPBCC domain-containing protein n=1 Tax=Streptomyces sp. NPDC088124 TaxID=3154654 RepID=UPI00341CF75F
MEHEVFVPVSAETLRQTLRDPARVARCVPGLQQDADASAGPLSGRLKVRIGGHTITYRGALTLAERDERDERDGQDGRFEAEGAGAEVRGSGSAKLTLTIRLREVPGGTIVTFTGGARADGRLAEVGAGTVASAGPRLLDRFAARLGEESAPEKPGSGGAAGPESGTSRAAAPGADSGTDSEAGSGTEADAGADADGDAQGGAHGDADIDGAASVFDVDVPPSSLDGETTSGEGDFRIPDVPFAEPPAEAAHARRTMIGRSAEEVDHAPPRGRYAPVPAPDAAEGGGALRWIAPAAALALASAVVVGRALRRRK